MKGYICNFTLFFFSRFSRLHLIWCLVVAVYCLMYNENKKGRMSVCKERIMEPQCFITTSMYER